MNMTRVRARSLHTPRRSFHVSARVAQMMTAGCLAVAVLGIASPSWAGPMMGC
jgi:hypothetical protein